MPVDSSERRNFCAFIVSVFRHYKRNAVDESGRRLETDSITVAERRDNWDQD